MFDFDDSFFRKWLEDRVSKIQEKVSNNENFTDNDINILTLKGVSNHVYHLEKDMKGEFIKIGEEFKKIDERFEKIDKKFEKVDEEFKDVKNDISDLRRDMNNNNKWLITTMIVMTGIIISFMKFFAH